MSARSFWPPVEAAQVDYETLRAHILEHCGLPQSLAAARFARRGLAGLIAWPSAEPVFVAELLAATRPPWTPHQDPRVAALAEGYEFLLDLAAGRDRRAVVSGWAGSGVGAVGRQGGLVGEVVGPADVALVVLGNQHRPLGAGPLDQSRVDGAVGIDPAAGGIPAVHLHPGIAGVLQYPQHPGVSQCAPTQLPGPGAGPPSW